MKGAFTRRAGSKERARKGTVQKRPLCWIAVIGPGSSVETIVGLESLREQMLGRDWLKTELVKCRFFFPLKPDSSRVSLPPQIHFGTRGTTVTSFFSRK